MIKSNILEDVKRQNENTIINSKLTSQPSKPPMYSKHSTKTKPWQHGTSGEEMPEAEI